MTSSDGKKSVDSPHKGQWSGAFMFSLISAWTNVWPNDWDAGDLRRHGAHYDVTAMQYHRTRSDSESRGISSLMGISSMTEFTRNTSFKFQFSAIDAELWCFLWTAPSINRWGNNREAGDLKYHHTHYDVTVMHPDLSIKRNALQNKCLLWNHFKRCINA